jgi:hypothetical protein
MDRYWGWVRAIHYDCLGRIHVGAWEKVCAAPTTEYCWQALEERELHFLESRCVLPAGEVPGAIPRDCWN